MTEPCYQIRKTGEEKLLCEGLDPILNKIFQSRGLNNEQDLDLSIQHLHPPGSIKNIQSAVELLYQSLKTDQQILIVGDYDADGATSTALCVLCLREMGFKNVDYFVPDRFKYGYGLSPDIVELAAQRQPQLIITVDNGIASHEGIGRARELGISVLVTDHHLPADTLPDANCIINPNQPDCNFPSKALAGVGVAFYLMSALRAYLRDVNWFEQHQIQEPHLGKFLDLVALGTVADVVPLDQNNRRLVNQGLHLIRQGKCRPGIRELLTISGRNLQNIQASDLGFSVGPRLNAAGRLVDMAEGIECLLAESDEKARHLARQLDSLNKDRRLIETDMKQQALEYMSSLEESGSKQNYGICLYQSDWHSGVIGIIASRLKDRYHRPSIVFADSSEEGDEPGNIKGSCRSIPGLHIRDLLDAITKQSPALIKKFGGHAMAAGLTIAKQDFEQFRQEYYFMLKQWLHPEQLQKIYLVDCILPPEYINLEFALALQNAGPWGQHFPEPLFYGAFDVKDRRVLADKHLKLKLSPQHDNKITIDAIAFNAEDKLLLSDASCVDLVYRLNVNEYRGHCQPQLFIEYLVPELEDDKKTSQHGSN